MELLKIRSLTKIFPKKKEPTLKNIDFDIYRGEVLGLVGESGCGKTTLAKCILRLTRSQEGSIFYDGIDILKISAAALRKIRKDLQIIFQDPYMSLDPRVKAGDILKESIFIHYKLSRKGVEKRAIELLEMVGLSEDYMKRFPRELSGGERQRIGIARALSTGPKFVICDEPVSNLDISIQAQILNLLMDIQKKKDLTYLFISHDLGVVSSICDRVGVMKEGNIIELNECTEVFKSPKKEYTKNLLYSSSLSI